MSNVIQEHAVSFGSNTLQLYLQDTIWTSPTTLGNLSYSWLSSGPLAKYLDSTSIRHGCLLPILSSFMLHL